MNWFKSLQMNKLTLTTPSNKLARLILFISVLSISYTLFFISPILGQATGPINAVAIINLTNRERAGINLPPLIENQELSQAAYQKALAILENDKFSHEPDNSHKFSYWIPADYHYLKVGENLAMGFGTPEQIVKAWMDSQKHKDNILDPKYKEIGVAVVYGKLENEKTYLVVQYFGVTANPLISENLLIPQIKKSRVNGPALINV